MATASTSPSTRSDPTTADALSEAAKNIAATVSMPAAIVCFTSSGSTARRIARERPAVPIMVLTPKMETARRSGLLWGAYAVHTRDVDSFEEMVAKAKRMALRHELAEAGDRVIVMRRRAVRDAGIDQRAPRRAPSWATSSRIIRGPKAAEADARSPSPVGRGLRRLRLEEP